MKNDFETTVISMLTELKQQFGRLETKVDRLEVKVDNLETKVDNLETKVDNLETKVDNLETKTDRIETNVSALQENVSSLNAKVDRLETKTDKIEEDVDIIKNVNLATIIEAQQRTNEKIDETRKELSDKIDKYIKSNEVEHKKFDYKISRLELGLGVAEDTEKYNLES